MAIVGFSINNMVILHSYLSHYQRVNPIRIHEQIWFSYFFTMVFLWSYPTITGLSHGSAGCQFWSLSHQIAVNSPAGHRQTVICSEKKQQANLEGDVPLMFADFVLTLSLSLYIYRDVSTINKYVVNLLNASPSSSISPVKRSSNSWLTDPTYQRSYPNSDLPLCIFTQLARRKNTWGS